MPQKNEIKIQVARVTEIGKAGRESSPHLNNYFLNQMILLSMEFNKIFEYLLKSKTISTIFCTFSLNEYVRHQQKTTEGTDFVQ